MKILEPDKYVKITELAQIIKEKDIDVGRINLDELTGKDVIIFSVKIHIDYDTMDDIIGQAKRVFPDAQILVLPEWLTLEVIRRD